MIWYIPVAERLFSPFLGHYSTFGIAAMQFHKRRWECCAFVSDVSVDEAFTVSLANACTQAQLSPVHLRYVIEDVI